LLDGLQVTTHWEDIEDLKQRYPKLAVLSQRRWVDSGKYTTSGGISAGIDMSLYLVAKLKGEDLARQTAIIRDKCGARAFSFENAER